MPTPSRSRSSTSPSTRGRRRPSPRHRTSPASFSRASTPANPPDVIDDSGAQQIKLDVLYKNNQLADLTPLLDAPYIDDPTKKIRDVLQPGTIETGSFADGKMRQLSYIYTVWGFWYSGKLFKDKGWTEPKTWADFMSLSAEIKAAGIAPFCHQGKYPYYINVVLMDLIAKNGGLDYVKRIDQLDTAVWDEAPAKTAVEALYEIVTKGYLLPGTNGLTHIESQTAWNEYKAAFIPCGSWLENEQLKATPSDFDMKFMPLPSLPGDKLPFEAIRAERGGALHRPGEGQEQGRRHGVPAADADQGRLRPVRGGGQLPHRPQGRRRRGGQTASGNGLHGGRAQGCGQQHLQLQLPQHGQPVRY